MLPRLGLFAQVSSNQVLCVTCTASDAYVPRGRLVISVAITPPGGTQYEYHPHLLSVLLFQKYIIQKLGFEIVPRRKLASAV